MEGLQHLGICAKAENCGVPFVVKLCDDGRVLRKLLGVTMRRALVFGAIFVGAVAVLAEWRVPQVRVLLSEGFPAEIWPAKGQFVSVAGQGKAVPLHTVALSEAAQNRFEAAGGRAMIVWQAGQITGAAFGAGQGPETRFNSFSMVKGLVGVLVLRAIAEGRIESRDTSVRSLLGAAYPDVTVGALLTMTGGLSATDRSAKTDRDEGYRPWNALGHLHAFGPDAAASRLRIKPDWTGGFHYQSANTALLGRVLERVYDMPLQGLLSDTIWAPAGAGEAVWRAYPNGEGVSAYCCLYARASDWLAVGRFLLTNGAPEAPLLPEDLWRDWLQPSLPPAARRAGVYGDHLRHDVLDREGAEVQAPFAYFMGHGGQILYLVPDLEAVVVRFGAEPQLLHSTLYEVLAPLK